MAWLEFRGAFLSETAGAGNGLNPVLQKRISQHRRVKAEGETFKVSCPSVLTSTARGAKATPGGRV
jgi:hypothetical protein